MLRSSVFRPDIDTLSNFVPAVHIHLLTAVTFPARQYPDFIDGEACMRSEIREDQVDWNFLANVLNVIIHHHHLTAGRNYARKLVDNKTHFEEIVLNHGGYIVVVKLTRLLCLAKQFQNFLESLLTFEGFRDKPERLFFLPSPVILQ